MRQMSKNSLLMLTLACVLLPVLGCNQDQIQEVVDKGIDQTTQVVEQTVETVKQETNQAGSMDLTTNPPLAAKACYAELIDTGEGRPNVFRLASYRSSELERFPSIIIEAQVEESSLQALTGKTLSAKIYAQNNEDGIVHATATGSPASISVLSVDETTLTCECSGQLISSETGSESTVSGKFVAPLD